MSYRVYCNNLLTMPSGGGACAYYRILLPLTTMEKMGLPIATVLDNSELPLSGMQRDAMFMEADFTLIYQQMANRVHNMMNAARKFKAGLDENGERHWPPTFVVDTDDDLFNVMPLNTAYRSLGWKKWGSGIEDGTPCEDGDEIGIAHPLVTAPSEGQDFLNGQVPNPIPGARGDWAEARWIFGADGLWHEYRLLYKDGYNVNFATNRKKMDDWREVLRAAHLITTTTPKAAAMIRREVGDDKNVFVSPNAIDFDAYPKIDLRDHPGRVRVLWEGSACHHEGLWNLNDSLKRLVDKYPQTDWVFFGAPYRWAFDHIPAERVTHIPWVHYEAYKLRLSTIGHDIAIAPLAPSVFNQSRSAIRWYENTAIWKPAAVVAQRTAAFEDEMTEGETGMLFSTPEEFEEKMSALIESETLRQTLASNAKDWLRTNREVKDISRKLFMAWMEARENHKATVPLGDSITKSEEVAF